MDTTTLNHQADEPLQYPAKWISGKEMIRILKLCGANVRHFASYCGRSENYIRQSLGYEPYQSIPLMYIDKLRDYVGEENLSYALTEVRKELEKNPRYKERMLEVLKFGATYRV